MSDLISDEFARNIKNLCPAVIFLGLGWTLYRDSFIQFVRIYGIPALLVVAIFFMAKEMVESQKESEVGGKNGSSKTVEEKSY